MIIYPKTATANRKVATLEGYNAPKLRETIIFNRAISYALWLHNVRLEVLAD